MAKRLAVTKAELEEVNVALKKESSYLGICGSDLSRYAAQLEEKEQLLLQIVELQVLKAAAPPPGPPATFDRCSLSKVVQHMLDYEAVPTESIKALRALASLAYKDVNEVAGHRTGMAQLLRLAQLHPDEDQLQLAAMKCLCHLAFDTVLARRDLAGSPSVLDALLAARHSAAPGVQKVADEATARIIAAEATATTSTSSGGARALLHIFRAEAQARGRQIPTTLRDILKLLSAELVDVGFLAECFIEAAPAAPSGSVEEGVGWLSLLVDLIGQNPALVCPGAAVAATALMDAFPRSLPIQSQGVAALTALAASRGGPKVVADAKGVKSVESAQGTIGLEDAELQTSCINFLVSVLDWPLDIQDLCDVDYPRVVSVIKEAMQRHLEVVSLQVAALCGLAKIVEVLSVAAEMKAAGTEGLIKTVLAHHREQKQVWTWGRILLDNMGLDRNWTLRDK